MCELFADAKLRKYTNPLTFFRKTHRSVLGHRESRSSASDDFRYIDITLHCGRRLRLMAKKDPPWIPDPKQWKVSIIGEHVGRWFGSREHVSEPRSRSRSLRLRQVTYTCRYVSVFVLLSSRTYVEWFCIENAGGIVRKRLRIIMCLFWERCPQKYMCYGPGITSSAARLYCSVRLIIAVNHVGR